MKKLLACLFLTFAAFAPAAEAAIYSGTVWEVRHAGATTQCGGFSAGISIKASNTDLAVSSGSNVNVSSAAYGFSSADVGRWLSVTSGTGFTVAAYKITAVSGGVATLSASPAAVSTTGGSYSIFWGIDYSQQNAANSATPNNSTTDAVTLGTAVITSASATFSNDIIGNVIYVAGGTGSITGACYQVTTYTSATSISVDRSTGLTTGTGATMNIGGAIGTWAWLATNIVSQNKAFVKADATYQISTGININADLGGGTNGGGIYGYKTTRGDGIVGSTNYPTLQGITTSSMTLLTMQNVMQPAYITFDCNSLSSCTCVNSNHGTISYNKCINYTNYGIFSNANGDDANISYNEVTAGQTGANSGIYSTGTTGNTMGAIIYGNNVHDGIGSGIETGSSNAALVANLITNMSGASSDCVTANNASLIYGNTLYNCGRYGVNFNNHNAIQNNIIVGMGSYGIFSSSNWAANPLWDGNAYYNNSSGNRNGADNTTISSGVNAGINPYINAHDIQLTASPFVNASTGNFSLNSTAGGGASIRGMGVPTSWPGNSLTTSAPSMGVSTPSCSAGSGSCSVIFAQ